MPRTGAGRLIIATPGRSGDGNVEQRTDYIRIWVMIAKMTPTNPMKAYPPKLLENPSGEVPHRQDTRISPVLRSATKLPAMDSELSISQVLGSSKANVESRRADPNR